MAKVAVQPETPEDEGAGTRLTDAPRLDGENRVMPRTLNRGITCVVEVKRDLRRAMQALDVAIDIFDSAPGELPVGGASHRTIGRDLTRLRDHLLGVEAELNRTWSASPWGG